MARLCQSARNLIFIQLDTPMRKLAIALVLIVSVVYQGMSAHIIGGDMHYTCVGVGSYDITINIYRDCNGSGADFDSSPGAFTVGRLTIYQGDQFFDSVNMPQPSVTQIDLTTGNPCLGVPPDLCAEQGVYEFNVNLPVSSESYYIVYQRCCRNPTINNIVDPGDVGATYSVEMTPLAQATCNSSPRFNTLPPSVICVDELLEYDHSATDIDGDFIAYSFCEPVNGGTSNNPAPTPDLPPPWNPIQFQTPYSFDNPMLGNPQVTIDNTGLLSGVPEINGQFVVSICAEEFRNGQLLSTTRREYQFNVTTCIPFLNAQIQSTEIIDDVFIISDCGDLEIEFNDLSFPPDNVDSYYWELPVSLTDTLRWEDSNSIITLPEPGVFNGLFVVNPFTQCSDTAEFRVIITPPSSPFYDQSFERCDLGDIAFENSFVNPSVSTVEWAFGDGQTSTIEDPFHTYDLPGAYEVSLTYTDSLGCDEVYLDTIRYYPIPEEWDIELDSMTDATCPPVDLFFSVKSDFLTDEYDVTWRTGDGGTGNGYNYTHTYEVAGIYDVGVDIESPTGCMDSRNYPAFVDLPFGFFVPNIFSPDAFDEANQSFCIDLFCELREYEIRVYDNNGNITFQSTDVNACWDGFFDGVRAEVGVYVYRIDFLDKFGVARSQFGDVTLIY